MNPIRRYLIRRRMAKLMKPCPQHRAKRLAQMSPERAARYRRNMAEIGHEIGEFQ